MRTSRFVLCVALLLSLTAALFASGAIESEAEETQVAPGPLGRYTPPITVTAVRSVDDTHKYHPGDDAQNNPWMCAYEEELGIKIEFLWVVSATQWEQKMNVSIAAGDLPDIMPADGAQVPMLVEAGLVQPLEEVYEEYASEDLRRIQFQQGTLPFDEATYGGHLMGLPETVSFVDASNLLWVREDWRNALGLAAPTTFDALVDLMYAFAQDDPDGDGADDTFGYAISNNLFNYGYGSIEGLANIFGAFPTIWIRDAAGDLAYGSVQPEMQEALELLKQMYADGVIDPEFGVKDRGRVVEDTIAGMHGIGIGAMWNPYWPYMQTRAVDPDIDLAAYDLPSVDGGPASTQIPSTTNRFWMANADFANPEVLVKLQNFFVLRSFVDNPREDWVVGDPASDIVPHKWPIAITNPPFKNLENHLAFMTAGETGSTEGMNSEQIDTVTKLRTFLSEEDVNDDIWGTWFIFGPVGAFSIINDRVEQDSFMPNQFFGPPTETMVTKGSTLAKMEEEMFVKYIMGDETAFDTFVADWWALGGDDITREVNEWAQR